jgi:hypothetical protein
MLKLHPHFLVKDGRKQFVVLQYEEFVALQEWLADADNLLELRQAKQEDADSASVSIEEVKREFGVDPSGREA